MTPKSDGRHCAHCDKVVRDFTAYSDSQILSAIKNDNVCGRFRPDQINRPFGHRDESSKKWISVIATTLSLAAAQSAQAQTIPDSAENSIHKSDTLNEVKINDDDQNRVILKGNVSDKVTGEELFQVYITVENTEFRTASNFDGDFELAISEELVENGFTMKFTTFGYNEIKLNFAPNEYDGRFIKMEFTSEEMELLGDVMIVEHKRWWEFWK